MNETIKTANERKILRNGAQRISNLLKLGRYGEAAITAQILAGIFRGWALQDEYKKQQVEVE